MLWSGLPTPAMYMRTKLLPVYVRYGELARRSCLPTISVRCHWQSGSSCAARWQLPWTLKMIQTMTFLSRREAAFEADKYETFKYKQSRQLRRAVARALASIYANFKGYFRLRDDSTAVIVLRVNACASCCAIVASEQRQLAGMKPLITLCCTAGCGATAVPRKRATRLTILGVVG
jgi:hypothetical protein